MEEKCLKNVEQLQNDLSEQDMEETEDVHAGGVNWRQVCSRSEDEVCETGRHLADWWNI